MIMRQNIQANGITEGVIWKQLLVFFFPILLGTFFQQLYNTVDAIIVGQFVGKEALAAVGGPTGTLINLLVGFFVGLSSGATVIISQYYGAGKPDETSKAVHTATALSLAGGAVIMAIGLIFSPLALKAMGTPDDIMNYSVIYIRVYFCGMIPNLIYNMGSGILRAVGDSKRPLYFLIVCCIVNVVLDLLFVLVFKLGVLGAALATILSQLISAILVLVTLIRSVSMFQLNIREIRFTGSILKSIIQIGIPAGLQSIMYSMSNIIIQASINQFGTDTIAAWTAYSKIDGLFWMIMGAFGIAITTFTGQNFGAKKIDRVRKSVVVCLGMAFGTALGLSGILLLSGQYIYGLFTQDAAVLKIGMDILHTLVPFYFTYVCIEIFSGAVRGAGDSLIPTIITCVGVCALRVIWILAVEAFRPTLTMVIISYPISWSLTSLCFVGYYLQGGWLRRRMKVAGFTKDTISS
ncbi:MAG: MATE family efflux transporter [Massiliimalia sp.]